MAQTAANLVEHVLPENVPLRQLVLTLPFELRARLAYDGRLLGAVSRVFVDSVLGWYRRRFAACGVVGGKSGAVTVVQRVSSDLRLNPHLHTLALDGVFAEGAAAEAAEPGEPAEPGELRFHPLPHLGNSDVGDILQIARARILALLRREGVVVADDEGTGSGQLWVSADHELADSEPALAELARASVSGSVPAGPALYQRPPLEPIRLRSRAELAHPKALCATEGGFSLHAATVAAASDAAGREALCKYVLRPPIAQERLELVEGDLVRLHLKRSFSDGTFAIDLDPLSLLCRLAASVPPPRFNTVRYAGVLAAASTWRARVVPPPKPPPAESGDGNADGHAAGGSGDCRTCRASDEPPARRSGYRPWRELLLRTFQIDVERCDRCGTRLKLRALLLTAASVTRYLRWLGEPTDPPSLAPARDPPFFLSPVIRHRLGLPDPEPRQAELFGSQ